MALLAGGIAPARAQVGASLSLANDDRFRGHSLSGGQPVATLDLSYDHVSGFYLGGSGSLVVTRDDGVQPLKLQGYAGYARQIAPATSLDMGVTTTRYTHYYSGGRDAGYTEAYLGIASGPLSAHLRYAPEYFRGGVSTLYGDVDAVLKPSEHWRLNGHVGVLGDLRTPADMKGRAYYDWRIGISRLIGRLDLHLSYERGGPGPDYYAGRPHAQGGAVAGATYIF